MQAFISTQQLNLAKTVLLDAPVALLIKTLFHANHAKATKSLTLMLICAEYLVMAPHTMIGLQRVALIVNQVNT